MWLWRRWQANNDEDDDDEDDEEKWVNEFTSLVIKIADTTSIVFVCKIKRPKLPVPKYLVSLLSVCLTEDK